MAIVQVQTISASGSGLSLGVGLPSPVTVGNRVIVTAAAHAGSAVTGAIGTDTQGNAYYLDFSTSATEQPDFKRIDLFSAQVTASGFCSLTYTLTGPASGISLTIYEYNGLYSGVNFAGGGGVNPQLGAAFVDHGAAEGSAPFPPLTLVFASDVPPLAAYYGHELALLAAIGAYDQALTGSTQIYSAAQNSVLVPWPSFPILDVAVGVIVLYVGSSVVGALACSITITTNCGEVPFGTVGVPYFFQFPAGSGPPPFLYSIAAGSLPPGLNLNAVTGVVSGTPSVPGIYNFTISITNSTCNVGSDSQCIVVTTIMEGPPV